MGGEGVAKGMWTDILRTLLILLVFYELKNTTRLRQLLLSSNVFRIRLQILQLGAARVEIEHEVESFSDGDKALFVAFTRDLNVSLVRMEVIHLQMGQFAHPQSAAIEGLDDGSVSMA